MVDMIFTQIGRSEKDAGTNDSETLDSIDSWVCIVGRTYQGKI